ncbi:hypothetical protein BESB_074750 [Besnoitia besnoiti]|uniref:Uncharacterized protein n=1 Tax=Besnoitia besnoiti TaxID=94643 RepID=A0A2A9MF79_BESBE|nr:uncharacterized protein BESB_074750 [Besnoitia besnoiti]PFH34323.1 hypothetical protein BESB_074750 [Besnoitia besnoiti]
MNEACFDANLKASSSGRSGSRGLPARGPCVHGPGVSERGSAEPLGSLTGGRGGLQENCAAFSRAPQQVSTLANTQEEDAASVETREVYAGILERYRALLYSLTPVSEKAQGTGRLRHHIDAEEGGADAGLDPAGMRCSAWRDELNKRNMIEFVVASEEGLRLCSTKRFVDIAALVVLRLHLPPSLLSQFVHTLVQVSRDCAALQPLFAACEKLAPAPDDGSAAGRGPASSLGLPPALSAGEELTLAGRHVGAVWGLPRLMNLFLTLCALERRGVAREIEGAASLREMVTLGLLAIVKDGGSEVSSMSLAQVLQGISATSTAAQDGGTGKQLAGALQRALGWRLEQEFCLSQGAEETAAPDAENLASRVDFLCETLHAVNSCDPVDRSLLAALAQSVAVLTRDVAAEQARLQLRLSEDPHRGGEPLTSRLQSDAALMASLARCVMASKRASCSLSADLNADAATTQRQTAVQGPHAEDGAEIRSLSEMHEYLVHAFAVLHTQLLKSARQAVTADAQLLREGFSENLVRALQCSLRAVVYLQQSTRDQTATVNLHSGAKHTLESLDALVFPAVDFLECLFSPVTRHVANPSSWRSETTSKTDKDLFAAAAKGCVPYPRAPPNSPFTILATTARQSSPVSACTPLSEVDREPRQSETPSSADDRQERARLRLLDELLGEGGVLQLASILLLQSKKGRTKLDELVRPLLPQLPKPQLLQLLKILSQVGLLPVLAEAVPAASSGAPAASPFSGPPDHSPPENSAGSFLAGQLAARLAGDGETDTRPQDIQARPGSGHCEEPAGLDAAAADAKIKAESVAQRDRLGGALAHEGATTYDEHESDEGTVDTPSDVWSEPSPVAVFDAIVNELERQRRSSSAASGRGLRTGGQTAEQEGLDVEDVILLSTCFGTEEVAKQVHQPSSLRFFSDSLPHLAAERLQALEQAPPKNEEGSGRATESKAPHDRAALLISRVTQAVEAVHRHSPCAQHSAASFATDTEPAESASPSVPCPSTQGLASLEMSLLFEAAAKTFTVSSLRGLSPLSLNLLLAASSRAAFSHTQLLRRPELGATPEKEDAWGETADHAEDALRMWKAHAQLHNAVATSLIIERQPDHVPEAGQTRLFLLSYLGLLELRKQLMSAQTGSSGPAGTPPPEARLCAPIWAQDPHAEDLWLDAQETFGKSLRQVVASLGSQARSVNAPSDEDIAETLHVIKLISDLSPAAAALLESMGLPLGQRAGAGESRGSTAASTGFLSSGAALQQRRERMKAFFEFSGTPDRQAANGTSRISSDINSDSARDASPVKPRGFFSRVFGR